MSKFANPGELRTRVKFVKAVFTTDAAGYQAPTETNVFGVSNGNDNYLRAKWVNAHGSEAFSADKLELQQPATITCRYSPLINDKLLVYKYGDTEPYEIISVDNVEERNRWLEIAVKRRVSAR